MSEAKSGAAVAGVEPMTVAEVHANHCLAAHQGKLLYAYHSPDKKQIAVVATGETSTGTGPIVIGTWPADVVAPLLERYDVEVRSGAEAGSTTE